MSNKRSGVFIGGMLIGAVVGALTGLLVAPRTGRETRKIFQKSADALPDLAEDISTSVLIQVDRFSGNAREQLYVTRERLQEAIAAGIYASQRESQILKQLDIVDDTDESLAQHVERP